MIPWLAVIQIRARQGRGIHLWIPLVFLWILLLPFAVLALPVFLVYCLIGRVSVVRASRTFAEMLGALKGTRVQFENGARCVSLRIA
jgi:hypothetical protein